MTARPWLRRLLIVGGGVLALLVVARFAAIAMFNAALGPGPMARCEGHRAFEASRWQDSAAVYGRLAIRGCMVDDLLRKHDLRGRTRAEVVALLGEPKPTEYFREYDLVFWLGPERSALGIDSEWLVLRLDKSGRVAEHRLVTD